MRRALDRWRVRLGDFWLQGSNGWGQLAHAEKLTQAQAIEVARQLNAKGIKAKAYELMSERDGYQCRSEVARG